MRERKPIDKALRRVLDEQAAASGDTPQMTDEERARAADAHGTGAGEPWVHPRSAQWCQDARCRAFRGTYGTTLYAVSRISAAARAGVPARWRLGCRLHRDTRPVLPPPE